MYNKESFVEIGGYLLAEESIHFNQAYEAVSITVRNTGDRPIQVGSHFHFFEVNKFLQFDRTAAFGKRLNIASSTAIRFEPGDEINVSLIPIGGTQKVYGFNNLVDGWVGENPNKKSGESEKTLPVKHAIEPDYKDITD
ncbi:urease subunit beta [Acetobacteraceae bacterium]|nr:urease subunit beta [Acetobacteraceae bacterium]